MDIRTIIDFLRPKTFLLGFASIIAGFSLVINEDYSLLSFIFCLLTAMSLQVLSNIANDYGDYLKGTDNQDRLGPKRSLQKGRITITFIKKAIYINIVFCLFFGVSTLIVSSISLIDFIIILVIGIISIAAAIAYTVGKIPYGYKGLGDLAVLIFFGLVAVNISAYLIGGTISLKSLFLSILIGLLACAVLNLNNMRDIDNDMANNKKTLAVRLGKKRSCYYHSILISIILISIAFIPFFDTPKSENFIIYLATAPLLIHLFRIWKSPTPPIFNKELKTLSISTFLFSCLLMLSELL